jgi:hypothetical protein
MAINKALLRLTAVFDANTQKLGVEMNKANKKLDKFDKGLGRLKGALAGAFAADKVIQLGKHFINTSAKFQKMEAVLTNTLGSNSRAQQAMDMISDFASKTPFQVSGLTDSFVRLANQGFTPTRNEMRKMGDLASSTGKDFDQLAEAVLDAQTGEFERLKEFGIRASKSGDQVAFTFKGVEKQVQFTDEAIRDYILSLGDAEGVSGAMAAISETTGGKLSNLQDSWESLSRVIGDAMTPAVNKLAEGLSGLAGNLEYAWDLEGKIASNVRGVFSEAHKEDIKEVTDLAKAYVDKGIYPMEEAQVKAAEAILRQFDALEDESGLMKSRIKNIKEYITSLDEQKKKEKENTNQIVEKIPLLERLEEQIKAVKEQRDSSVTPQQLARHNTRLDQLQEEKKRLMELTAVDFDRSSMGTIDGVQVGGVKVNSVDPQLKSMNGSFTKVEEKAIQLSDVVQSAMNDMVGSFAEDIAGLMTGAQDMGSILQNIGHVFGNFISKMGKAIIAYGTSMEAFQKAFNNPWAAIAAGGALVIAGTMIKQTAAAGPAQMANGGIVPPGYPGDTYPALLSSGETVVPPRELPNFAGASGAMDVYVHGDISGDKIKLLMDRAVRRDKRTR